MPEWLNDAVMFVANQLLAIAVWTINLILMPITNLIFIFFPGLNNALLQLAELFDYFDLVLGRALDLAYLFIPYQAVAFALTFLIIKLSLPVLIYTLKVAVNWYRTIKG